jgi:hypothetical protein
VSVSLLLHPVLQDHGDAKHQYKVNTYDAKGSGEDLVQVLVCVRRELGDAPTLLRSNKGVQAGAVLNERRCCRVYVAAAVELGFVSILTAFR